MQDLGLNKIGSLPSGIETRAPAKPGEAIAAGEFQSVLQAKSAPTAATQDMASALTQPLKFSSHALTRLRDRGISLGKEQMTKLEKAVDTAAEKGAKESLILSNDAAFIVSVKNRTVITVVDRNSLNGNVFTNIDSTVVI